MLVILTENLYTVLQAAALSRGNSQQRKLCIHFPFPSQTINEFPGDCWNSENITEDDGTVFQQNAGKNG